LGSGSKMKKKEVPEYIREFVSSENAKNIVRSSLTVNSEGFNLWSFKKLIFLEYYLKLHLQILENKGYKCIYIDFFSSCGANQLWNRREISIGSPIISLFNGVIPNKSKGCNNRFTKWFFVDINPEFCESLKERVTFSLNIINKTFSENLALDKDVVILNGDINEKIAEIITTIKQDYPGQKIALLAFIDPYSFSNVLWNSWKTLLNFPVTDIIFTLPTYTMNRGVDVSKDKENFLPPSLIAKCKDNHFCDLPLEEISRSYAQDIVKLVGRGIHFHTRGIKACNSKNGELYRILLFSHSEAVFRICNSFANQLEKIDVTTLKSFLDQATGKQNTLF
jgi:three-Cys-motif partner protein